MEITELQNQAREYFYRDSFNQAADLYDRCIQIEPDNIDNYWRLGLALLLSGEESDARDVWMSALMNVPENFDENNAALKQFLRAEADRVYLQGKLQQAESIYRQIIELEGDNPQTYCNLGFILGAMNRLEEASQCFQHALELDSHLAIAWRGLADSLATRDKLVEAIASYRKAIELGLRDRDTLSYLGLALQHLGDYRAAISCYQEALAIEPQAGIKIRQAIALPIIAASTAEIESARLRLKEQIDALLEEKLVLENPVKEVDFLCFYLSYHGKNDRELHLKMSQLYEKACPSLLWTAPHCQQAKTSINSRKIKIGFFSTYFKNHVVNDFICGLIAKFSREWFSVYVFSTPHPPNPDTDFVRQHADEFIVVEADLENARKTIARYELDILFYPETALNCLTYFLAFARLAPIQCTTWGHPVTTGIKNIDYFLSSIDLDPENASEHYTEKLILLEKFPTYYYKIPLPESPKPRSHFNLSEDYHLYICLQSLFKFHPDFDKFLRRILQADPLGKLVLIQGKYQYWQEQLMARFHQTMPDVIDRIIIQPRLSKTDFLNLMLHGNAMLDPIHYGGGHTNYEAFALGVPVVTLTGKYMRSRYAYACYKRMGLIDCIANDEDKYVEIALRLGNDPDYRQQVSQEILSRKHVLFEDETAVREIEQCLLQLVR